MVQPGLPQQLQPSYGVLSGPQVILTTHGHSIVGQEACAVTTFGLRTPTINAPNNIWLKKKKKSEWLNNNWLYILVSIYTKQVFYFFILFFKFDSYNGREWICTLNISIENTNKYQLSYKIFVYYIQIGNCKKAKKINNSFNVHKSGLR